MSGGRPARWGRVRAPLLLLAPALSAVLAALALPAQVAAQVDEPPVVDPNVSPRLPVIPPALAAQVERARRLVRRTNRCRVDDGDDWGSSAREGYIRSPRDCYAWEEQIDAMPREVRIHAYGLEYVRNAMIVWPASAGPRYYERAWLWHLGRGGQPVLEPDRHHPLQIPYLVRALSALDQDTLRHQVNAGEVIRTLREVTRQPVTGRALEGYVARDGLARRRRIAAAWVAWQEARDPAESFEAMRARGLEEAEAGLSSETSATLADAFFIRWRASRRLADWAPLCRRVLGSPALSASDRRQVSHRCTYSRIGWREMTRLHREARARRRADEAGSAPQEEPSEAR